MESSSSLENALSPKPAVVPIPLLDILLMAISFFDLLPFIQNGSLEQYCLTQVGCNCKLLTVYNQEKYAYDNQKFLASPDCENALVYKGFPHVAQPEKPQI